MLTNDPPTSTVKSNRQPKSAWAAPAGSERFHFYFGEIPLSSVSRLYPSFIFALFLVSELFFHSQSIKRAYSGSSSSPICSSSVKMKPSLMRINVYVAIATLLSLGPIAFVSRSKWRMDQAELILPGFGTPRLMQKEIENGADPRDILPNFEEKNEEAEGGNWEVEEQGEDPRREILTNVWNRIKLQSENQINNNYGQQPVLLPNFLLRRIPSEQNDLVLVTHTSISKLENLRLQLQRWNGPSSIGIYINREDDIERFVHFLRKEEKDETKLFSRSVLHVAIEMEQQKQSDRTWGYPHNILRNTALTHCGGDFFVAVDVDHIVKRNAYAELYTLLHHNTTRKIGNLREELLHGRLLVLPAFEIFARDGNTRAKPDQLPSNKKALKEMVKNNQAYPFHLRQFPPGHTPTDFKRWFRGNGGNSSVFYPISYQTYFEPYVMGCRLGIPPYWDHFRGFGRDKTSWFQELDRAGYKFGVLTNQFVLHLEHPSSFDSSQLSLNLMEQDSFDEYLAFRYGKDDNYGRKNSVMSNIIHRLTELFRIIWQRRNNKGDPYHSPIARGDPRKLLMTILNNESKPKGGMMNLPPLLLANLFPRNSYQDPRNDLVLVTHLAASKLDVLRTSLMIWNGPSSVAIYIKNKEDIEALSSFLLKETQLLLHTTIHLAIERPQVEPDTVCYPKSILRNLALTHCGSDFFLALDVDHITTQNAYNDLYTLLNSHNNGLRDELRQGRILVLPAFDLFPNKGGTYASPDQLPASKNELRRMVDNGQAGPFQQNTHFQGHGATHFPRWFQEDEEDEVSIFYSISYQHGFEPYVMGFRPGIPAYWPHFCGYGYEKESWFEELNRAGYKFGVLKKHFVVHLPHPTNINVHQLLGNQKKQSTFFQYLDMRYGNSTHEDKENNDDIDYVKFRKKNDISWLAGDDGTTELSVDSITVVITTNATTPQRFASLERLVESLLKADYSLLTKPNVLPLHVNIDADTMTQAVDFLMELDWPFGPKTINHRIKPVDVFTAVVESWYPSTDQDAALLLEDNIEVSPYYYYWLYNAMAAGIASRDDRLMGISLYTPRSVEVHTFGNYKFDPSRLMGEMVQDPTSPYLHQLPCSWGALYFGRHWQKFTSYMTARLLEEKANASMEASRKMSVKPPYSTTPFWKSSWKKYMIEIMYVRGWYMLYPSFPNQVSFSTNHVEIGDQIKSNDNERLHEDYTVPLFQSHHLNEFEVYRKNPLEVPPLSNLSILDLLHMPFVGLDYLSALQKEQNLDGGESYQYSYFSAKTGDIVTVPVNNKKESGPHGVFWQHDKIRDCKDYNVETNNLLTTDSGKLTLLLATFDRFDVLRMQINYFSKSERIDLILVTWYDIERAPPPPMHINGTMVEFLPQLRSSLNHRFLPSMKITTQAVMIMDDDMFVHLDDIELLHETWMAHRNKVVGFFPERLVDNMYHRDSPDRWDSPYQMMLTKVMVLDKRYLHAYSCEKKNMRAVHYAVDSLLNCEDIAMNFVVSHHTSQSAALFVEPIHFVGDFGISRYTSGAGVREALQGINRSKNSTSSIFHQYITPAKTRGETHVEVRNMCYTAFSNIFLLVNGLPREPYKVKTKILSNRNVELELSPVGMNTNETGGSVPGYASICDYYDVDDDIGESAVNMTSKWKLVPKEAGYKYLSKATMPEEACDFQAAGNALDDQNLGLLKVSWANRGEKGGEPAVHQVQSRLHQRDSGTEYHQQLPLGREYAHSDYNANGSEILLPPSHKTISNAIVHCRKPNHDDGLLHFPATKSNSKDTLQPLIGKHVVVFGHGFEYCESGGMAKRFGKFIDSLDRLGLIIHFICEDCVEKGTGRYTERWFQRFPRADIINVYQGRTNREQVAALMNYYDYDCLVYNIVAVVNFFTHLFMTMRFWSSSWGHVIGLNDCLEHESFVEQIRDDGARISVIIVSDDVHNERVRLNLRKEDADRFQKFARNREERCYGKADVVVAVSHEDAIKFGDLMIRYMRQTNDISPAMVKFVPYTVKENQHGNILPYENRKGLLIAGNPHDVGVNSMVHFLTELWPTIRMKRPNLRYKIVGKIWREKLDTEFSNTKPSDALPGAPHSGFTEDDWARIGIDFLGFVAQDVLDKVFFQTSLVFVVPHQNATGVSTKIIEALSRGIPVVTNNCGKWGLNLEANKYADSVLFASDDKDEFIRSVLTLVDDKSAWDHMSNAAIAHVREYLSERKADNEIFNAITSGRDMLQEHVPNQNTNNQSNA